MRGYSFSWCFLLCIFLAYGSVLNVTGQEKKSKAKRHPTEGSWKLVEHDGMPWGEGIDWFIHRTSTREIGVLAGTDSKGIGETLVRRYTIQGETCTYTREYSSKAFQFGPFKEVAGKKDIFTFKIVGDTLTMKGVLSSGAKIEQVFKRIK